MDLHPLWQFFGTHWRDVLNILAFLIAVIGLVYSILSWRAAKRAKTSAEAAKIATDRTRDEIRQRLEILGAAKTQGHIHSALECLRRKDWKLAAFYLKEVSDELGQFAAYEPEWKQHADDLLEMVIICSHYQESKRRTGCPKKWNVALLEVLKDLRLLQQRT